MVGTKRAKQSGQVLVVALLGIVLLVSLIFYTANVGDQVNRKVAMQNAADSAADAGARWMAKTCNVIAINNVAGTRMLALIPVLDAFPLATKMAYEDVANWELALRQQLQRGVYDSNLRDGLESLRARMVHQRDILAPMNGYFNPNSPVGAPPTDLGTPITPLTYWSISGYGGPPPHGRLWQAAESLDEFSQAAFSSAAQLSQANAARYGQLGDAELAFITPILPELPALRTSYMDFQRPVRDGRIPDDPPPSPPPQRLGPYDRLFLWRDYKYRDVMEPDHMVGGTPGHGPIRGGGGNVNVGGRVRGNSARGTTTDPNPHWAYRSVGQILLGYTVFGPYEWMMRRVNGYAQGGYGDSDNHYYAGQLADTYFHEYHRRLGDVKLDYMWNKQPPQMIHYSQWVVDYPKAKQLATSGARVFRTMFYLVEIRSKYKKDTAGWMTPGSFVTNGKLPIAMWVNGWSDPEDWKIPKKGDYVWEDQYNYETTCDWDIGIQEQLDASGQPVWQKVYMVSQYVFGGIDIGGDIQIANPANWSDASECPAPIIMDKSKGEYDMSQPNHDLGVRRNIWTYLGVASQSNSPRVWPQRFGSGNPYPAITAVAQAEIFNTRSFELWTQDWKAQLVPVTRWDDWCARLQDGLQDVSSTKGLLDGDQVRKMQEFLSRLDASMASDMLQH
jgi:hypothetical protein